MLLSLHLLEAAAAPLRTSPAFVAVLEGLQDAGDDAAFTFRMLQALCEAHDRLEFRGEVLVRRGGPRRVKEGEHFEFFGHGVSG